MKPIEKLMINSKMKIWYEKDVCQPSLMEINGKPLIIALYQEYRQAKHTSIL